MLQVLQRRDLQESSLRSDLGTAITQLYTTIRHQCCFVLYEDDNIRCNAMHSFFMSVGFSLLVFSSVCSVNGQTLIQSTVNVSFKCKENATMAASDQQPSGALISPQEKEKMKLSQKIIFPFLILLGTFGNAMIIVIHKRTALTSSMSVFFLSLAASDLMLICVSCFTSWIKLLFDLDISAQNSALCKLVLFLLYVSGVQSAWTLVAMTAQRAVCVLLPHRANILCTVGKSKAIVVSMVLFMAAMHTHLLFGFHVVTDEGGKRCTTRKDYTPFFYEIWGWADMLIVSLLPWLCLAVSNSLLVWKLRLSLREAKLSLGSGQADRINDRKKKATSISITLIAVSTAFLVLNFPMSLYQILSFIYWMNGSVDILRYSRVAYYTYQISFPLWHANGCINFYIYCLTGSKFRREAKQTLRCMFRDHSDKQGGNTTASTLSSDNETRFT